MNWRVVLALATAVLVVCMASEVWLALRAAPHAVTVAPEGHVEYSARYTVSAHVLRALISAAMLLLVAAPLSMLAMAIWRALRWHRPLGDILIGSLVAVAAQVIVFLATTALQSSQALLRYEVIVETALWGGAAGLIYWLAAGLPRAARS